MIDIEKIKDIILEKVNCKREEIIEDVTFQDLGLDSLDAVELIMAFEEEFDIEISDKEADSIKTVGDAMKCIEAKVKKKK